MKVYPVLSRGQSLLSLLVAFHPTTNLPSLVPQPFKAERLLAAISHTL